MKPTSFKEQNVIYAKDQPQYQPLPALKFDTPKGEVVCCWKMSWKERLRALWTGRIWICILSYNQPLRPHYVSTRRMEMFMTEKDIARRRKWFYRRWSRVKTGGSLKKELNNIFNQN